MTSRRRRLCTGAALLLVAATLAACGGRGDDGGSAAAPSTAKPSGLPALPTYTYAFDDKAVGPAPATPGAVKGGTVRVHDRDDLTFLDPARIYVTSESTVSTLFTRTLTGYRQNGTNITLIGDLATDTGRSSEGGKVWTYTLRDGITWEDGSPITSADVKYGIERTFVPDFNEGPTYIQSWLAGTGDFRKVYKGPWDGKGLDAISTPDDKTIVLTFPEAQPDVPWAVSMTATAPVKKDKDTREQYKLDPFSAGPYKITDHKRDKSMVLERNDAWKPESDPIRTNYPDRFEFTFGEQPLNINQRIRDAVGADAASISVTTQLSPELRDEVMNNPDLVGRTVSGYSLGPSYWAINTKRLSDIRVRKALLYAMPRQQLRQYLGGPDNGEFASTIAAPSLVGFQPYDLYNAPPAGDPEKAKALLAEAGVTGPQKIVYAMIASPRSEAVAVILDENLRKAGFELVKKVLDIHNFQYEISKPDSQVDLTGGGWLPDWPSGSTMYPPLFDGRQIRAGGYNTSLFNDDAINKEMDEITKIVDQVEAGKRWAALDRKLMEQVPVIPNLYSHQRQFYGPKIGGAIWDNGLSGISLNGIYVKP